MPLPRRSIQLLIATLTVAAALAACNKRNDGPIPTGDVVASLPAKAIDDSAFDPASLKGKPSIVMFASPTCGYCIKEMPLAQKAAQDKGANAVVVFVAGAKKDGKALADKLGFTGPVLHDDGTLKKQYQITGVPYTVITKPDGTASSVFRGMADEGDLAGAVADAR